MAFQTPITISKALGSIERREYVLPAIQREFVWWPDQIERLFDSLMRGYPIGSFLFWIVRRGSAEQYKFYDFMLDYHERDNAHCASVGAVNRDEITAVLDGQQRLTALNIGLRGSYAYKLPRKWWNSPDAFPTRHLYLNILAEAEENEAGMRYDFRFLTRNTRLSFRSPLFNTSIRTLCSIIIGEPAAGRANEHHSRGRPTGPDWGRP